MLMTDLSTECPEPGVYENVSFDEYNGWRALSNSALTLLDKSPRHYAEGERSEPTEAMRIGELAHCGVFEPSAVAERYVIMPPFELDPHNCTDSGAPSDKKTTKWYRARVREFEDAYAGREIVPRAIYEQVISLVRELSRNERANMLLNDEGPVELCLVWDEQVNGFDEPVRFKGRIDKVAIRTGAIVDLKKCPDVTDFNKVIANRKLHRQMAAYQRGWAALHNGELLTPWLIAHETTAPISVVAAPLSDVSIMEGEEQFDRLLARYCECRAADAWPGVPNPPAWELPEWAISPVTMFAGSGEKVEV